MGPEKDWEKITPYSGRFARIFNLTTSLFGTFDMNEPIVETVRKQRVSQIKRQSGPVKKLAVLILTL